MTKYLTDRERLISKLTPLEKKGKVKINYDTGEVTLLGKDEKENREIIQQFMFTSPKTCLQMMQQMTGGKQNDNN
jgi:hypothetical protein